MRIIAAPDPAVTLPIRRTRAPQDPSTLKSWGTAADTSHMPIIVTTALSHESDQPNTAGGGEPPQTDPPIPGATRDQDGITPERLQQVIRRLETGFYDTPEVRDLIARKVREELDP